METNKTSLAIALKADRQRKFLLALPVLVFPFLTFLLWSLGILVSTDSVAQGSQLQKGLNMSLPDAQLKEDKSWDKLAFYEQAEKDSVKWKEQLKNDPYYMQPPAQIGKDTSVVPGKADSPYKAAYDPSPYSAGGYKDANEEKVYKKIEALNKELEKSVQTKESQGTTVKEDPGVNRSAGMAAADIDRLEAMMQNIGQNGEDDSEINQLNGMMERILDIQHPQRVQEKLKKTSIEHKGQVFPVTKERQDNISLLQSRQNARIVRDSANSNDSISFTVQVALQRNGFFSLDDNDSTGGESQNAIEAVVHESQTIVPGATVKLRLLSDIYVNGILIPAGHFVYGIAGLNGERLEVSISTIGYRNNILPVSLSVYDVDGMAGMYMPGAITRDVMKQSADQSLQGIGLTSLDASLAAQAGAAGIDAAKTLLSKKVRLVKVTVKAGYRVLLRDNKDK